MPCLRQQLVRTWAHPASTLLPRLSTDLHEANDMCLFFLQECLSFSLQNGSRRRNVHPRSSCRPLRRNLQQCASDAHYAPHKRDPSFSERGLCARSVSQDILIPSVLIIKHHPLTVENIKKPCPNRPLASFLFDFQAKKFFCGFIGTFFHFFI